MTGRTALISLCLLGACASDPASTTTPTMGGAGGAAVPGSGSAASPATATAGTGTTGTSGAANGGSSWAMGGGYVTLGEWHGYAFTSASGMGSTIAPMTFETRPPGQPLCAAGSVGAAMDYSGTALVGVNLNQPMGMTTPMSLVPSKAGLYVQVKNTGGSTLRVQIQGPNGATDANDRWCAPIPGTSAFVPWAMFNTKCWDGSGTAYANQPLVAAMVLVPGGATAAVPFDFCIETLMAADDPPSAAAPAAGSGSAAPVPSNPAAGGAAGTGSMVTPGANSGSGMLTDKYAAAMVMRDGRSYFVQNNVWGDNAAQTVKYNGTTFEIIQQTGMNVASGGAAMGPVSYPSAFIGSNHNRSTPGSNLPKQVSALRSVKTGWSHNASAGISGVYNAAYDVWFSTGPGGDSGAPSGGYLMVWYEKPAGAQPIGTAQGAPVTIPGVSGQWDVWVGANGGRPCISYVRTSPVESLDFDLKAFIDHSLTVNGGIQASWYLTNVFAGFEIWSGGVGLKTTAFYAIVE
jgi:hypothetical protein